MTGASTAGHHGRGARARAASTHTVALALMLSTGLVAQDSWIRVPDPDLSGLETAVADQLAAYREITATQVANETAGPGDVAAAVGELGRYYHAYELGAPAEECYRIASRLTPEDFRWHYFLAYLHQNAGRLDEAEAAYLRALEIHRAAPPALLRLAEVYVEMDRLEAAASLMREARRLDPSSAAAAAALGELYQQTGRNEEAIELLKSALELVPEANRLYYPLALAYRATGEVEQARWALAQSGKVGVKSADPLIDGLEDLRTGERVHLLTGQRAFRAGRYAEAAEAFRRAVESAPESVTARIDLGSALGELGEVEQAIEQYERALETAAGNVTALFNLGVLESRHGEVSKAITHLRQAAQFEPKDAAIRLELAEAHRQNGDLEDALIHFRAAAELDPPGEDARLGAARAFVARADFRAARDVLEEGLRLLPSSGLMAHALSRLLAMGPDVEMRDGKRALELASKVYAARPSVNHAEVLVEALAESGRCEEAAAWLGEFLTTEAEDLASSEEARLMESLSRLRGGPPCSVPGGPGL